MDIELPFDFKEFLKLLNENGVKYLLIGGYAVGYHGYSRATNDMDVSMMFRSSRANSRALSPGEQDHSNGASPDAPGVFQVWNLKNVMPAELWMISME